MSGAGSRATTAPVTERTGDIGDAAAAWEATRADPAIQFAPVTVPPPSKPPGWLEKFLEWLGELFAPLGRAFGSGWPVMRWVLLALAVAAAAFLIWRLVGPALGWRAPRRSDAGATDWVPDARGTLALLEDADRLAAEGRFDEATHLLLQRSVGQIAAARPEWLEPATTAREMAAFEPLPAEARHAFAHDRRAGRTQRVRAEGARARRLARGARGLCRVRARAARRMSAFRPRTVLLLVLFGAAAFLATLWLIGAGKTDSGPDNGEAHAAGHGLAGYAALAAMLERQGHEVTISRNRARLDDEALLVLTPTIWTDADDLAAVIDGRRYTGPTLLILPKWYAARLPPTVRGARKGWVHARRAHHPGLRRQVQRRAGDEATPRQTRGRQGRLAGLGLKGHLPVRTAVTGLEQGPWASWCAIREGATLAAYADDHGCYPVLDAAAGSVRRRRRTATRTAGA